MTTIEALLVARGLDEIKASLWAKFLQVAFESIRDAEAALMEQAAWDAHVARDGALLKPRRVATERLRRLPSEEGLTCGLAECLWDIRVRAPSDHPLRQLEVQFHSEARMPSKRRTGKHARRTDIWARSATGPKAPNIVLEAKLVVSDDDLDDEYLGPGGLGCFTDPPEPYTRGHLGALLAYTVEDGAEPWPDRILAAMAKVPGLTASVSRLPDERRGDPDVWCEINRPKLGIASPICIAHIVMRFRAVVAQQP